MSSRSARSAKRPQITGSADASSASGSKSSSSGGKRAIHLDGLVVLKIVKHAHESNDTSGILLGLAKEHHLEITNCFPKLPADQADKKKQKSYTSTMLKLLREVKIDNFKLGWYQAYPLSSFCTEKFVQTQYDCQSETAGAAAIVYDPASASLSSLCLKAFRLSDKFMKFMAANKKRTSALTAENVAQFKLNHNNIVEEIPVKIHNSELSKALLCELARGDNNAASFEKLDLSVNPYLEKHVESLQDELDQMIGQMDTLHDYLKEAQLNKQKRMKWLQERRAKNKDLKKSGMELLPEDESELDLKPVAEPSRLNGLLVTKQIASYCNQINSYMSNSKIKLDVARTFQDSHIK